MASGALNNRYMVLTSYDEGNYRYMLAADVSYQPSRLCLLVTNIPATTVYNRVEIGTTQTDSIIAGQRLTIGDGTIAQINAKTPGRNGAVLVVGGGAKAPGDVNGSSVRLGNGGLTIIGAGEFKDNFYNLKLFNDGDEHLVLGADGDTYICAGANTIANRKTWTFDSSGSLDAPGSLRLATGVPFSTSAPSSNVTDGVLQLNYQPNRYNVRNAARHHTSGNIINIMEVGRFINGAWVWNSLQVGLSPTGERSYSVSDPNAFARAIGVAKTKGDSWSMNGYVANGYLTNGKQAMTVMIDLPYILYGFTSVKVSGTMTVRQNNTYLFGSTADTPANIPSGATATAVGNCGIRVNVTGTAQSAAINNNPIACLFNTLTITLS